MLNAYLTYSDEEIAIIKIDKFCEGEANRWAINQTNKGKQVYVGKYSIKHANWRWYKFIAGTKTNFKDPGIIQPDHF